MEARVTCDQKWWFTGIGMFTRKKCNDINAIYSIKYGYVSSRLLCYGYIPDSKVHGANMGPTWVLSAPDGPHVGPMNLAIKGDNVLMDPCDLFTLWWLQGHFIGSILFLKVM